MGPEYIAAIIAKQLQGEQLSPEEQRALENFQLYLKQRMDKAGVELAYGDFQRSVGTAQEKRRPVHRLTRWAVAAAVLLAVAGGWLLYSQGHKRAPVAAAAVVVDVAPGKQGAVLTLAGGRQVVLDSLGNGLVAAQNGADVTLENGRLTYTKGHTGAADLAFNTMSTPRGRKFQLVLPDGTKVWMNAASTLTFPTVFTGSERKVAITGEAYFEVAKNAAMPFKVMINDKEEVEVLGTSFDVHAYAGEANMRTTLLEGSVRVSNAGEKVLLKPGQLAAVRHEGPVSSGISVRSANIEKVMAWKNDLFDFEDASLTEVMNEVSRWYDIDVVYEKGIPSFEFGGKIRRDLTLAGLLKFLEGAGVHFRIEAGRRLVVMP